jgi:hypothetical protein
VFQTVPGNAKTLIKWAEHLFRYLFQTHVAAGAFMPSSGTEHFILGGVPSLISLNGHMRIRP